LRGSFSSISSRRGSGPAIVLMQQFLLDQLVDDGGNSVASGTVWNCCGSCSRSAACMAQRDLDPADRARTVAALTGCAALSGRASASRQAPRRRGKRRFSFGDLPDRRRAGARD
jgi:hypothetical protein